MIDLNDYAHTAAQRGWGAGWPSCSGARQAGLAVARGPRSGVGVSVHRRIARLVGLLLAESERRSYLLRYGQTWGYACRAIAGTSVTSNHSWGLAIDINSFANPYQFPRRTDMPTWMPLLWNRYGFAWGGLYNNSGKLGKSDPMHYEFMGTPEDADGMTALALYELAGLVVARSPDSGQADSPVAFPIVESTVALPIASRRGAAGESATFPRDEVASALVFLCHSSGDGDQVRQLYLHLKEDGIRCWLDKEDLLPGHDWEYEISRAIDRSRYVLVCLSADSITKMGYVQTEIRKILDAADRQPEGTTFVIPVRLEACPMPERLKRWQSVDLFSATGYQRLVRVLTTG
jgi:hypothetical protein